MGELRSVPVIFKLIHESYIKMKQLCHIDW
jgi:hypothetical protein